MRNILFRGKRLDNGEWVEGGFFKTDDECYIITNSDGITFFDLWDLAEFVTPETVGQYTGLTDKNGKKIFEGDIIQFGEDEDYDWDFNIGVVKFGEGTFDSGIYRYTGFFYEDKKGNIDHNALYNWEEYWEKCKVIGNIHDNTKLFRE